MGGCTRRQCCWRSPRRIVACRPDQSGRLTRDFLRGLGRQLGRPRAVLVVCAHRERTCRRWSSLPGFARLRSLRWFVGGGEMGYEPTGVPDVAEQASDLLGAAGLASSVGLRRGMGADVCLPRALEPWSSGCVFRPCIRCCGWAPVRSGRRAGCIREFLGGSLGVLLRLGRGFGAGYVGVECRV